MRVPHRVPFNDGGGAVILPGNPSAHAASAQRTLYFSHVPEGRFTARPATTLTADRSLKSWSVAARPDGCACRDSREPASSCSACSARVRGSASSSVAARCRGRRSDVCCSQGTFHFEIAVARVERVAERSAMAAPDPESRACACSTPRRRAGRLPCALRLHALPPP